MKSHLRRLAPPAALALFAAWRAFAAWSEPAWQQSSARRPQDPVIRTDLPSAMSFLWPRPLFAKPSTQASRSTAPAEDETAQIPRLVGIIVDGDSRVALMELKGKLFRGQQGGSIGFWSILSVEPRSVLAENHGSQKVFLLDQK